MAHFFYFFIFSQTNFQNDAVEISREAKLAFIESSFAEARSAAAASKPNRSYAPSRHVRCSQMQACKRTHTTCSDSVSDQAKWAPRCAFALPFPVRRDWRRITFCFVSFGRGVVVRRPSTELCNHAPDGVTRRSLLRVLPHKRRQVRRTI